MKVLVYGVGGVGGFIGCFLEKTNYEITYVSRGERYNFIKNEGLILNSEIENLKFKKLNIINELNKGEHYDIIILTVKLYDFDNVLKEIFMGCYGIGVSRIVAAAIEQNFDDDGILFPESISPFKCYIILINQKGNEQINSEAERLYLELKENNIDVFFDDRDLNPGVKFRDANLVGVPYQLIIGDKVSSDQTVELIKRNNQQKEVIKLNEIINRLKNQI